jgi:hypothetical protein
MSEEKKLSVMMGSLLAVPEITQQTLKPCVVSLVA